MRHDTIHRLVALLRDAGLTLPLEIQTIARSRRVTLRLHPMTGVARLSTPPRVPQAQLEAFLIEHLDWLRHAQAALPPARPLVDGAEIPYQGEPYRLRYDAAAPRRITVQAGAIIGGGEPAGFPRRVALWLKAEARRLLTAEATALAMQLGKPLRRIRIGDPRSRWGSCNSMGDVLFSWRLICCPPAVRHYLVVHEVAHRIEMNHSPAFWAVVARFCPDADQQRLWLKQHGPAIMRIGSDAHSAQTA